jgi:hypothetical protein
MSFVWRSISLCGWNLLLLPMSSCQLVTGSYVKLGKALWTIVGEWTLFEIREDYTLESMKSSKISGCVFISFMYCLVEKCLWWNPVSLLKAWLYHIYFLACGLVSMLVQLQCLHCRFYACSDYNKLSGFTKFRVAFRVESRWYTCRSAASQVKRAFPNMQTELRLTMSFFFFFFWGCMLQIGKI